MLQMSIYLIFLQSFFILSITRTLLCHGYDYENDPDAYEQSEFVPFSAEINLHLIPRTKSHHMIEGRGRIEKVSQSLDTPRIKCVDHRLMRVYKKYSNAFCSKSDHRQAQAKNRYHPELLLAIEASFKEDKCKIDAPDCGKKGDYGCICLPFKLTLDNAKFDRKKGACKMTECSRCLTDEDCFTGYNCSFTDPPVLTSIRRLLKPVRLCQKANSKITCQHWAPEKGNCGILNGSTIRANFLTIFLISITLCCIFIKLF